MTDALGWLCFSNVPFRWVGKMWFHRWVLWPVGIALAIGLPLASVGMVVDQMGLVVPGVLLALPFQLWVASLGAVSCVLALPRFAALGVGLLVAYLGWPGLAIRLADWAAKFEETPNESFQQVGPP